VARPDVRGCARARPSLLAALIIIIIVIFTIRASF